ncbi:hypothetical protein [Arthrobacter sp. NicSoilB8]|uniref:hypothetical protein n=1 Tax=Arthrobacter sp. NicSoilB8 TaxID=2830998 RepID=UPI001CC61467|nr:hypothetical protein [Arthrobacter sp. NicSoilB8]BCW69992.1 hypothetical protein NicSoilB8_10360 [Arthrobacter sp. NicSoilB8]
MRFESDFETGVDVILTSLVVAKVGTFDYVERYDSSARGHVNGIKRTPVLRHRRNWVADG